MAITVKVSLLLLGLVVACSAGVTHHQAADTIGPFNKNVLLGRGLAAMKREQYNNGCNLDVCWDSFYNEAFKSLTSCNSALVTLKSCVESGLTSQDLCKCNYQQVKYSLQEAHDQSCSDIHSRYGKCAEEDAQSCFNKVSTLSAVISYNAEVTDEDKKTMYAGVEYCLVEVEQGRMDTMGCGYLQTMLEGTLVSAKAWSEGCSFNGIDALCPSPIPETPEHCSAQNDVVANFYECAKAELPSAACQNVLPNVVDLLNGFKTTECSKINDIQGTIEQTCGAEGRKRTLLKNLLNLLEDEKK